MVGGGKTLRGKQLLGFRKAGRAAGAELGGFIIPKERKCFLLGVRNPTVPLLFFSPSNCWNQRKKSSVHCARGKTCPKDALWFYIGYIGKY